MTGKRRPLAEMEALAAVRNATGFACTRGHAGQWRASHHSTVCRTCHRERNRAYVASYRERQRLRDGRAAKPKVAGPRPATIPDRPEFILPWNRGIGPEEPSRP